MTLGFLYWLLMIFWLVFGLWPVWPAPAAPRTAWWPLGGYVVLWVLLFLLGWKVFGWPIQGGGG